MKHKEDKLKFVNLKRKLTANIYVNRAVLITTNTYLFI